MANLNIHGGGHASLQGSDGADGVLGAVLVTPEAPGHGQVVQVHIRGEGHLNHEAVIQIRSVTGDHLGHLEAAHTVFVLELVVLAILIRIRNTILYNEVGGSGGVGVVDQGHSQLGGGVEHTDEQRFLVIVDVGVSVGGVLSDLVDVGAVLSGGSDGEGHIEHAVLILGHIQGDGGGQDSRLRGHSGVGGLVHDKLGLEGQGVAHGNRAGVLLGEARLGGGRRNCVLSEGCRHSQQQQDREQQGQELLHGDSS